MGGQRGHQQPLVKLRQRAIRQHRLLLRTEGRPGGHIAGRDGGRAHQHLALQRRAQQKIHQQVGRLEPCGIIANMAGDGDRIEGIDGPLLHHGDPPLLIVLLVALHQLQPPGGGKGLLTQILTAVGLIEPEAATGSQPLRELLLHLLLQGLVGQHLAAGKQGGRLAQRKQH